jgi:protein phosphatase
MEAKETMIRTAFCSDRGPRNNLEDAVRAAFLGNALPTQQEITILVVCDGVGGQRCGEVAAMLGTVQIIAFLTAFFAGHDSDSSIPPDIVLDGLGQALRQANDVILRHIEEDPRLVGMATTAVCAVVADNTAYVGWAGDSRCYTFADGLLRQVTEDHSEVQQLVSAGLIHQGQAKNHPLAHIITHHLGQVNNFAVGLRAAPMTPGSVLLLCTDGLTDVLGKDQITDHVREYQEGDIPLKELPRRLVRHALHAGTRDNVTVLCGEYQQDSLLTSFHKTRTGAYPVQLARTLRLLSKEPTNVPTDCLWA